MLRFIRLYFELDSTTSTNAKVELMRDYFREIEPADGAWAVFFLTGRKLKRLVAGSNLREWARERAKISAWLFEECYAHVGDLSETIALLAHPLGEAQASADLPLSRWVEERIRPLPSESPEAQKSLVGQWWDELGRDGAYILTKILTGGLRIGVSQTLVIRALAEAAGKEGTDVTGHLVGEWKPDAASFERILSHAPHAAIQNAKPFPFCLAHPLESEASTLGALEAWQVEWKWDGIRAQIISRAGEVSIWTRGDELVTARFPELRDEAAARLPPGCVVDGEILAFQEGKPLRFGELQRRIGKLKVGRKLMDEVPVAFMAYDLLELDGADLRSVPLARRRSLLEGLLAHGPVPTLMTHDPTPATRFFLSELVDTASWDDLSRLRRSSRERGVEGFMLKRKESSYGVGRKKGDWWKWKIDPYTVDAVLLYAQAGHGKRANLYTDYTFAVWDGDALVPVAKAYSGLDNAEIEKLDRWIRSHTKERFGPVRSVEPVHVFELAFEAISLSKRHKAGVAVRFPRIARWRHDKGPEQANTLSDLKDLLKGPVPLRAEDRDVAETGVSSGEEEHDVPPP